MPRTLRVLAAAGTFATVLGVVGPAHADIEQPYPERYLPLPTAWYHIDRENADEGYGHNGGVSISGDGRFVTIDQYVNAGERVVVWDRRTGDVERADVSFNGADGIGGQQGRISDDGRYVVFTVTGRDHGPTVLYVRDRTAGTTTRLLQTAGAVTALSLGGPNGIAFWSNATDLVPGADTSRYRLYRHDMTTGTTKLVFEPSGTLTTDPYELSVSPGGRFMTFSWAVAEDGKNVRRAALWDRTTGQRTDLPHPVTSIGAITREGVTAFATDESLSPQDTDTTGDVYLRNAAGTTTPVSSVDGGNGSPTISSDGRFVLYRGGDAQYHQHDLTTGRTRAISTDVDGSPVAFHGTLQTSRNGRFVTGTVLWRPGQGNWTPGGVPMRDLAQDCTGEFTTLKGAGTVNGGPGDDVIEGSSGGDVINGGAGDDVVCGGGGDDVLSGNYGDDALYGGTGDDEFYGRDGNDVMDGGTGDDELHGGPGTDAATYRDISRGISVEIGEESRRKVHELLNSGDDIVLTDVEALFGSAQSDRLLGGSHGDDFVYGMGGGDTIYGDGGDDRLFGGAGDDYLHGVKGNDRLYGFDGRDRLFGNAGEDFLSGGDPNPGAPPMDYCHGGPDLDIEDLARTCEARTDLP